MRALTGFILLQLGLSGCFNMPVLSNGKVLTLDEAPRLAESVSYSGSKSVAAYDPNSKVATTIPAPSGALSGSSVTLPAGALAIAAELVVEEAISLSQMSLVGSLNISADIAITPIGSGLIIRPTEDVDLTQPLTIAMPINPLAGLRTWLTQTLGLNNKYYTVFYQYFVNGELKAGAIRSDDLRFTDNGSVVFEGYFGAYWLAEVSAPIEQKIEIKTDEPIINRDNVAVVTSTGLVTETEVLAKAALPPTTWAAVNLNFDASQRQVTITAKLASGPSVSSCQLDLFEKVDASAGINLPADSSLSVIHAITKQEAHNLVARFRCLDDQARLAISPWSASLTIPAVPAATAVVVAPQPTHDFCGSSAAELRLIAEANTMGTSGASSVFGTFTYNGSCIYTLDVDMLWGMGFGLETADRKISCSTSLAGVQVGEQTLDCAVASSTLPKLWLPQGNYALKLDFTASMTMPKLTVSLQSCALGDLYLLSSPDRVNWPTPAASNQMTHLGGCQYSMQTTKTAESVSYIRIQNQNQTYVCGDQTSLSPNSPKAISCGASGTDYMQYSYGSYISGYKYILNLGHNLDMLGQPTTAPYLWMSEIDKCMESRYLLGPTSAGMSRQLGVNSFRKVSACNFNYAWMQSGSGFTPFFIGLGEGAEKCGLASGTVPGTYTSLDCSAAAVAVDLQSMIATNGAYRLSIQSDSTTGKPSSIQLQPIDNVCSPAYYAVKASNQGFYPNVQMALTEVSECIYQYDWLPTAANKNLVFVDGNWPASRCGLYPGYSNPTVGGPAVEFACYNNPMPSADFPFTPTGIVEGSRYKVNLDFRLGYESPKISVANYMAASCPELHAVGLNGLNYADPSNRMTKIGDCNYAYTFKTAASGWNSTFHIAASDSSFECGRDVNAAYAYPTLDGRTVPLACAPGTPSALFATLPGSSYFQILVHYDNSGDSKISLNHMSQNCPSSTFDGPSSLYQNGSYSKNLAVVDNCVEELLWMPTSTANSFRLRMDYYGYASYCGLSSGAPQPSLSGAATDAICNIFNVAQVAHFGLAEGVSSAGKYLIRLDRSGSPFDPPKLSVNPTNTLQPSPMGTYLSGANAGNSLNSNTHPGARSLAAVWSPPDSPYRYMYGGHGYTSGGGPSNLADLWRYDSSSDVWTLLPANDYGPSNGLVQTTGTFDPLNRPSGRQGAVAIYDPSGAGKLWLFGGEGFNSGGSTGLLSDLWVYDLGINKWALMSGSAATVNANGSMGTPGSPSPTHLPGSRRSASGWIDGSGKLYIYGGYGRPDAASPQAGSTGLLNDLWVFDPSAGYPNHTWTFLGGANLIDQLSTASHPASRQLAMAWKDPAGHFWLFGGSGKAVDAMNNEALGNLNDMWSYNPASNIWTRRGGQNSVEALMSGGLRGVSSPYIWPAARHAAAAWSSADGKLWLFGGNGQTGLWGAPGYLNDVWNFNPSNGQWTWVSGLSQFIAGAEFPATGQNGVYGPLDAAGSYQPGSRSGAMAWPDANGNVWIFGGYGHGASALDGHLNDLWYLDY